LKNRDEGALRAPSLSYRLLSSALEVLTHFRKFSFLLSELATNSNKTQVPFAMPGFSIDDVAAKARALSGALEPFTGSVYFSPECHANYEALGFAPSKAKAGEVQLPDGPAYFTSRGSLLGQVPGEVVASAFAVFNPVAVVPSVTFGWTKTDAATIRSARHAGAVAQLVRILGAEPNGIDSVIVALRQSVAVLRPEGRPLFAGLSSGEEPSDAMGMAWWLADQLREYRGDSHTAAWIAEGFDAVEIGLLTELWWGLPLHTYVRTRAWTDDDVAAALERLQSMGYVENGAFTERGREIRGRIETQTDLQLRGALDALGDEFDRVVSTLNAWSAQVRAGHGYLAAGPQDLAARASTTP
jgi:hypothetical protein